MCGVYSKQSAEKEGNETNRENKEYTSHKQCNMCRHSYRRTAVAQRKYNEEATKKNYDQTVSFY